MRLYGNGLRETLMFNAIQPLKLSNAETTPLIYELGSAEARITQTMTISDTDAELIIALTIQISENYCPGEDRLGFRNTENITGYWDAGVGVLTLSGMDTALNYQAACRSVTYHNSNCHSEILVRTVRFQATDGLTISNVSRREICLVYTASSNSTSGLLRLDDATRTEIRLHLERASGESTLANEIVGRRIVPLVPTSVTVR